MELNDTIFDFRISDVIRLDMIRRMMEPRGFTYLGHGKERFTFLSPNKRFVLKWPRWPSGIEANMYESARWRKFFQKQDRDGILYAPCRLLKHNILMMWAATDIYGETHGCSSARKSGIGGYDASYESNVNLPDWAGFIDCCQVGRLRNGKIAAYDYGG